MSINAGHQALGSSLLISCSTINLTCKKQAMNLMSFEAMIQLVWREVVIFYCITRTKYLCILETLDITQSLILHLFRQRRAKPIKIILYCSSAFRFHKQLMKIFTGETFYFILYTRAITRAFTLDTAGKKGRFLESCFKYIMNFL